VIQSGRMQADDDLSDVRGGLGDGIQNQFLNPSKYGSFHN
jgi:hypothetical protein